MQSATRIAVSAFLITSALASAYQSSTKLRRDGVLNMYPFPRVGRAQRQTWQVPLDDLHLEYKTDQKRQLYAFPRVGRSGALSQQLLATDNSDTGADNSEIETDNKESVVGNRGYKRALYAFPRVGRSEALSTASLATDNRDMGADNRESVVGNRGYKRALYAFPRVGRSEALSAASLATNNRDIGADNRESVAGNRGYKRSLYSFHRVGRSHLPFTLDLPRAGPQQLQSQIFLSSLLRPHLLPPQPSLVEPLVPHRVQDQDAPFLSHDNSQFHEIMTLMLSMPRNALVKRSTAATDKSAMWFGPRLGRAGRGDDQDITIKNQTNELSEPAPTTQVQGEEQKTLK